MLTWAARCFAPAVGAGLLLAACGGAGAPSGIEPGFTAVGQPQSAEAATLSLLRKKIKHVVIVVQENRSFDNLFQGFPGADTQPYGYTSAGQKVTLHPIGLETSWDIDHSLGSYFAACDGTGSLPGTKCKMDGFDKESVGCGARGEPPCPSAHPQYAYVPHRETKPYFAMGKQYVVADRMFASNLDGSSFISHQYIIAGQANSAVNYPYGLWGCDGGPSDSISTITQQRGYGPQIPVCFDDQTLGDELDRAGKSWHFYTSNVYGDGGIWSAYQAISHIRNGPDWNADVITPQSQFLQDAKNGVLPAVSWVTPTCEHSDHAGCGSKSGPAWVASVVNAVGQGPDWNTTAIFLMWDDYGGWYDHVPPPMEDYDGLGIRIPLVIVSPYAKQGYVSHVQYEHGSILRFVEDAFRLPRLAASDARAASPAGDCFDFRRRPRAFQAIPSSLKPEYFLHEKPDLRPPDTQ